MHDPNNEIDSLKQEIDRITHRLDNEVETYDEEYQKLDERRDHLEACLKALLGGGEIPPEESEVLGDNSARTRHSVEVSSAMTDTTLTPEKQTLMDNYLVAFRDYAHWKSEYERSWFRKRIQARKRAQLALNRIIELKPEVERVFTAKEREGLDQLITVQTMVRGAQTEPRLR